MQTRWVVLGAVAVLLGCVAELAAFDLADVRLWLPDLLVGWVLVASGLVGAVRRPTSRTGPLLAVAGLAWFLGNFTTVHVEAVAWLSGQLVYLHRGVLVHVVVTYPDGSLTSRRARWVVAAGYVASLLPAVWEDPVATVVISALLVGYCAIDHRRSRGVARIARRRALWAAAALAMVLSAGVVARAVLPVDTVSTPALVAYQAALCAIAVGLLVGLVTADWERTDVTDLVVELRTERSDTLRAALANALGDPLLEVGYWLADADAFVGADGRPLSLPEESAPRSSTFVENDGQMVAVLVHDPAVLDDPGLREAVTSATRLAAVNTRLTGQVRSRVVELEASRRRILETRDEERVMLERRLHDGAERRLLAVAATLRGSRASASTSDAADRVARAEDDVEQVLAELRRLAQGIHPRVLSEHGLEGGVRSLVERFPLPVELELEAGGLPSAVEAAAYYVCAEGLANVVKYASASRARVSVRARDGRVAVVVEDDGVGGADPTLGSGLRGLADRVAALGGTLGVGPGGGRGTRLAAEIPLGGENS